MEVKVLENTSVRVAASWSAQIFKELQAGELVDLGNTVKAEGYSWVVTTLPDGRTGYLQGDAKFYRIRPVTVVQPQADVYAAPIPGSAVIWSCKKGDSLMLMGMATQGDGKWVEVRTPTGNRGFILPDTKIKENPQDQPKEIRRKAAVKNMLVGGLVCVGGIVVTAVTIGIASSGSGSGHYVVFYGAIIFGGIQFVKGLIQFIGSLG